MNEEEKQDKKEISLGALEDALSDFLYYDRKEDEELSVEDMEELIRSGTLTLKDVLGAITLAWEEKTAACKVPKSPVSA